MPFIEAAEMGTHKVITEHSTIGMLVTTDGSIGEIPRNAYVEAEERIVKELKELGKPFAVILNSAIPDSDTARDLALELEEKYGVPVALVSCLDLDAEDIRHILGLVLEEFPVTEITVQLPAWTTALDDNHKIRMSLQASLCKCAEKARRMGEVKAAFAELAENEYVEEIRPILLDLGSGRATLTATMPAQLYYDTISELSGFSISNEQDLIGLMRELAEVKAKYDMVAEALDVVNSGG